MKIKVIGFVVALIMFVSVALPVMAASTTLNSSETVQVSTGSEFFDAIINPNVSVIELTDDIQITSRAVIRLTRELTIRGNFSVRLPLSNPEDHFFPDNRPVTRERMDINQALGYHMISTVADGRLVIDGPTIGGSLSAADGGELVLISGTVMGYTDAMRGGSLTIENATSSRVSVSGDSTFVMNGGRVAGAAPVTIGLDSTFIMNGGEIVATGPGAHGHGLQLNVNSIFIMNNGSITGDSAGIFIGSSFNGTIELHGGTISGNQDNILNVSRHVPTPTLPGGAQISEPTPGQTTSVSLPGITTASSWAQEGLSRAFDVGLIPTALQGAYTQAATRAEFTALAVALYETVTGRTITGRMSFNDTNDVNVQKMAYLGVVQGVGSGNFAPNNQLTREQAAVMITRLAEVIGQPLAPSTPTFADNANISSWAVEGVGQMQASGIMGGTGNNNFSPRDDYTREQSIMTMLRLFDILD